jgi:ATPase family AAA domain-containing protein 2
LYGRYQVDRPSYDDRLRYFNVLFESLPSLQMEESRSKSKKKKSVVDLPKAPMEVEGPKVSELITKAEAEQHAVRRMRMCLRDICNRFVIYSSVQLYQFVLTS